MTRLIIGSQPEIHHAGSIYTMEIGNQHYKSGIFPFSFFFFFLESWFASTPLYITYIQKGAQIVSVQLKSSQTKHTQIKKHIISCIPEHLPCAFPVTTPCPGQPLS